MAVKKSQQLVEAHVLASKPVKRSHGKRPEKEPAEVVHLEPNRFPWEIQPYESTEAFNAFSIFIALGPERSLPKVKAALLKESGANQELTSLRSGCLQGWMNTNRWHERAHAWDGHLANIRYRAYEDKVREMAESQANAGKMFQELAMSSFEDLAKNKKIKLTSYDDILDMFQAGMKIQHTALAIVDLPPPVVEQSAFDFSSLSTDEIHKWVELHQKLTGKSNQKSLPPG